MAYLILYVRIFFNPRLIYFRKQFLYGCLMCKYKKVLKTTVPPQSVGLFVFEIKPKNLVQQDLYWIGQCCLK